MTENVLELEQSLVSLEDMFLFELDKARNKIKNELYITLKEARRKRFVAHLNKFNKIVNAGDNHKKLELVSEIQEGITARLGVMKILLENTIPSACLEFAHNEILQARVLLEKEVYLKRTREQKKTVSSSHTILQVVERFISSREKSANRLRITDEEASELEDAKSATGGTKIYSSARELKMLAAYVRFHKGKQPPAPKGRSYFVAKELAFNTANGVKDNKSDKRSDDYSEAQTKKEKKDIAQTQEEIRKKLEERKGDSTDKGKAIFESRDLS